MPREELDRSSDGSRYEPRYDSHGRELVRDESGEELPVVPPNPAGPVLTPAQSRSVWEVYRMMAEELPVEGRDYSVRFSFDMGDSRPKVSFSAMTELGSCYIRHLSKKFQQRRQNGSNE